jgi:eukaryotic-like serine/threonine-protein kinase
MGEEDSIPRSDPENLKKRVGAGGAHAGAAGASAGGEPTLDTSGSGAAAAKAEDRMSIGPYVLVKKLGEGGMGQVWLAEQTSPVKRQVALKLIKSGLYDSAVIQRFEAERQSLAMMNHPAIAKVFDAGSTADGQPYFVMEYVDGLPITRYCDNEKLKIRERLELFIKMCEGVQHAHQKAIIHRDLKPSNILVAEVDGKPVPRIIDFGLAKAISPQLGGEQTQFTQMGAFVGTRGFMSPEQVDPNVLDVDTRTDVYSLGVVLYVMLTGMLPFDSDRGKKKPIDEVLRQLREEDPPSPSIKVNTEEETATAAAERRGTEAKQLVKLLRGDLDLITMKAVEKDRTRRYGTPSELAADIERYLENRPVVARPASTVYRLKKYTQRHRVGVTAALGGVALLAAFTVTQAVELRRITRERDRANRITDFMTKMFNISDPSEARGNTVTAREILDKAAKEIDTGLAKDPELQANMMDTMGRVYLHLGLYAPAKALLLSALDIKRAVLGPQHAETLSTANTLGKLLAMSGNLAEAEKLFGETLEVQKRVLGTSNRDTLQTMSNLAMVRGAEGHDADAEKLQRDILVIQRRVLGAEHPDTLACMSNLAIFLAEQGGKANYAEAEKLNRDVLEVRRRTLGADHPDTLRSMNNLAATLRNEGGHRAETETLLRSALDIQRRIVGPDHPDTLDSMDNLASVLGDEGHYGEAEKLQREILAIENRVLGSSHPSTLTTMSNLSGILNNEHKFSEAEKLERETLKTQREKLGPKHLVTLHTMLNLAATLNDEGSLAEAEKVGRETLYSARQALRPDDPLIPKLMSNVAATLELEGRLAESEKLLRETMDVEPGAVNPEDSTPSLVRYALGRVLAREGRREEALASLRDAMNHGLDPGTAAGMEKDTALKSLHGDPRFKAIIADARQRSAAQQKVD